MSVVWRSSLCAGMSCFSYMNTFIHALCTMLLCSSFKFMIVILETFLCSTCVILFCGFTSSLPVSIPLVIADSANSPISLYSLDWDENGVCWVVMVISHHHGDIAVIMEISITKIVFIALPVVGCIIGGFVLVTNNSPQGSVMSSFCAGMGCFPT